MSSSLSNKLSSHTSLFRRLLERLSLHPKAVVRLNLLRLVKTLFEASPAPSKFSKQPNLVSTINRLVEDDPSLLVKDLARGLLKDLSDAEKRLKSNRLIGNTISPSPSLPAGSLQRIGRTWSESAMSQILSNTSASSARYKLKARPNSPSLQSPASSAAASMSVPTPDAAITTPVSGSGMLPASSRRISIRAKASPPPR